MGLGVPNHFEDAFAQWLAQNKLVYVPIDDTRRAAFARCNIKSFDCLIYPRVAGGEIIIAELKGRRYEGKSLEKLTNLQCWVTAEDIRSIIKWEEIFGNGFKGYFVFVYEAVNPDVDFDRFECFNYNDRRYFWVAAGACEYFKAARKRSSKWQTVSLAAEDFRKIAVDVNTLLF